MPTPKQDSSDIEQILAQARPRRGMRIILFILSAIAIIWLLLPGNDEKQTMQFVSAEVIRGDLTVTVTATGSLEPLNQVEVGSEISGTIETVHVDFNDRVKKGHILARLNTDEQKARVVQARAAREVAEARVEQAAATVLETELELQRCQKLSKQGLCPPQDLNSAQAAYARAKAEQASAKAQVSQSRATLDVEQTRLAKAVIRSPIDGIVLKRQIEPGQTVAASLQAPVLFTLAENLTQMELNVAVDEADIGKVREGQSASFTVDAYGDQTFPAEITQVRLAPISEGGVVSYETVLSLDNKAMLLRPGMTATAQIIVEQINNALLVPNAALRFMPPQPQNRKETGFMDQLFPRWGSRQRSTRSQNGKQKQVWIEQDGQPKAIEVNIGASDGRMTQLLSAELETGTQVLTDVVTRTR